MKTALHRVALIAAVAIIVIFAIDARLDAARMAARITVTKDGPVSHSSPL